jgi:hypothetical protein
MKILENFQKAKISKITKRDPMGSEQWIAYKIGLITGITMGFIMGFLLCAYWRT